jgi:hypothetical protein
MIKYFKILESLGWSMKFLKFQNKFNWIRVIKSSSTFQMHKVVLFLSIFLLILTKGEKFKAPFELQEVLKFKQDNFITNNQRLSKEIHSIDIYSLYSKIDILDRPSAFISRVNSFGLKTAYPAYIEDISFGKMEEARILLEPIVISMNETIEKYENFKRELEGIQGESKIIISKIKKYFPTVCSFAMIGPLFDVQNWIFGYFKFNRFFGTTASFFICGSTFVYELLHSSPLEENMKIIDHYIRYSIGFIEQDIKNVEKARNFLQMEINFINEDIHLERRTIDINLEDHQIFIPKRKEIFDEMSSKIGAFIKDYRSKIPDQIYDILSSLKDGANNGSLLCEFFEREALSRISNIYEGHKSVVDSYHRFGPRVLIKFFEDEKNKLKDVISKYHRFEEFLRNIKKETDSAVKKVQHEREKEEGMENNWYYVNKACYTTSILMMAWNPFASLGVLLACSNGEKSETWHRDLKKIYNDLENMLKQSYKEIHQVHTVTQSILDFIVESQKISLQLSEISLRSNSKMKEKKASDFVKKINDYFKFLHGALRAAGVSKEIKPIQL